MNRLGETHEQATKRALGAMGQVLEDIKTTYTAAQRARIGVAIKQAARAGKEYAR